MAKSKSAKKKNQISKHILKSREDDDTKTDGDADVNADMNTNSTSTSSKKSTTPSKPKKKRSKHIKHPDEASLYLTQWKAKSSSTSSSWKFNKNTQSWLIRHMYEVEKVPKSTFFLLLEYLKGLEGITIKDRMKAGASRRCRRHKEYEKKNPAASGDDNNDKGTNNNDDNNETNEPEAKTTSFITSVDDDDKAELEYELALWEKLDDNEKRKQYKRARKILDLMKEV